MSLFNLLQSNDPAVQNGLLNFGLALLRSKGSFGNAVGQAGVAGQLGARDYRQQEALMKRAGINDQILQMQLAEQQRAVAERKRREDMARQFYRSPEQMAMAQNRGPTVAAAEAVPNTRGGYDYEGLADAMAASGDPMAALELRKRMEQEGPKLQSVPEGGRLGYLDRNNKWVNVAEGTPKAEKPPTAVQEYQFAVSQGYRGTFDNWVKERARAGASSTSISYGGLTPVQLPDGSMGFAQASNRGGAQVVPGIKPPPDAKADKPLTEAQAKAATFKSQMEAAERELATNPIDTSKLGSQLDIAIASTGANIAASPAAQRARQAQEQWAEAFLRFKTGAASTEAEVKRNVKTFFPQQGDSKEVIQQKARMRQQAINDLAAAATGKPITGEPPKASNAVNWSDLK